MIIFLTKQAPDSKVTSHDSVAPGHGEPLPDAGGEGCGEAAQLPGPQPHQAGQRGHEAAAGGSGVQLEAGQQGEHSLQGGYSSVHNIIDNHGEGSIKTLC